MLLFTLIPLMPNQQINVVLRILCLHCCQPNMSQSPKLMMVAVCSMNYVDLEISVFANSNSGEVFTFSVFGRTGIVMQNSH